VNQNLLTVQHDVLHVPGKHAKEFHKQRILAHLIVPGHRSAVIGERSH